jgi:hypothetical protein
MSSSARPSPIPLTGADCFLRAFDAEVRRCNGASHLSQLVLRLGPGFDPDALRKTLETVVHANPILRAPIRRPLGCLPPVYRVERAAAAALPRVEVLPVAAESNLDGEGREAPLPALFAERLNARFDGARGDLLRVDVVPYAGGSGGTDLAFTWLHMLFDGSGSERFVRFLDEVQRGARTADDVPADDLAGAPTAPAIAALGLRERGRLATTWRERQQALALRPPRSLAGPLARRPQVLRVRLATLGRDATRRATERAAAQAGFLTPMLFYLAAAIRAHAAVFRARGLDPGSYVVPLPVNLRPKGAEGAIFRTRVSLIWFQVMPEIVDDLPALLAELKSQRLAAIKGGLIEAGSAAMDFARMAPQRLYARMARRVLGGELCSFFFAWTDEFLPDLDRFFGAAIRNGFHVPSVPASPGSGAILSIRDGRLNAAHVHQAGVLSQDELELFSRTLVRDLTGG